MLIVTTAIIPHQSPSRIFTTHHHSLYSFFLSFFLSIFFAPLFGLLFFCRGLSFFLILPLLPSFFFVHFCTSQHTNNLYFLSWSFLFSMFLSLAPPVSCTTSSTTTNDNDNDNGYRGAYVSTSQHVTLITYDN